MEDLIDKTLTNLAINTKLADVKFIIKLFLEGLKGISLDNGNLKKELKDKARKIDSLENTVKKMLDEKGRFNQRDRKQ